MLYQQPKNPYLYFLKALEFYLAELFPCEYPWEQLFCKHWWTAAFENHVYLNSTEQFPEFQSDDVIVIHRTGNDLCSENTKFLWWSSFLCSRWRLFSFLNFMKTSPNLTKLILRGAWPWHSRSRIRKITGKSGAKFWKFISCVIRQTDDRFSKIWAK